MGLLRFCLPVNSLQKWRICRPWIISFFSYLFKPQIRKLFVKKSYVEIKDSYSRKGENQRGWSSNSFAKSSGKGWRETPINRSNLRLLLAITVALCMRNPLHPLGNERQRGTRCQETRLSLVRLSVEAGQLFTLVWGKPEATAINGHEIALSDMVFAGTSGLASSHPSECLSSSV